MRELDLAGKTVHSLRHFFATYLVSKEVPIAEVQYLMGHSDIKTTMKYVKVAPVKAMGSQSKAMNELEVT